MGQGLHFTKNILARRRAPLSGAVQQRASRASLAVPEADQHAARRQGHPGQKRLHVICVVCFYAVAQRAMGRRVAAMKLTPATGIAAEARPLLRALEPGQSVTVELPTSRYWRRLARSHLSAAAHAIHGRGV